MSRHAPETGFAPLVWLAAQEGFSALVGGMLAELFAAEPEGDARPMPFSRDENCATPVGPNDTTHPEYREAFDRLDDLITTARACGAKGLRDQQIGELRAAVASALNAGIYQRTAGALSPLPTGTPYFVCERDERPTRGQVRAWLAAVANQLGQLCTDEHMQELAEAVSAPLDTPAPRRSDGKALALGVALAVAGALYLAWRYAA